MPLAAVRQPITPGVVEWPPPLHGIMPRLEELVPGARVQGITPSSPVSVVDIRWHGGNALTVTYRDEQGLAKPLGLRLGSLAQEPGRERTL